MRRHYLLFIILSLTGCASQDDLKSAENRINTLGIANHSLKAELNSANMDIYSLKSENSRLVNIIDELSNKIAVSNERIDKTIKALGGFETDTGSIVVPLPSD